MKGKFPHGDNRTVAVLQFCSLQYAQPCPADNGSSPAPCSPHAEAPAQANVKYQIMQQLYCWKQEVKYHVIHVLIYQFKLCFQQMLKI